MILRVNKSSLCADMALSDRSLPHLCVRMCVCLMFGQSILPNNNPFANRANLEVNYAKGLQKLAVKLSKALQSTKKK